MNNSKPTIAFFGSSLVSAYWNGAATYYRGMIKNLYKLGYNVTFYEPDAFERQEHRDIEDPLWAKVVVYANEQSAVEAAIEKAKKADIIIKASGVGVFDHFLEKSLTEIKNDHRLIIFWDVDAPATLDSVLHNPDAPFRKLIPQYDFIFTYGGGEPVVSAYMSLNAKRCIPIYNALDPETHYQVLPEKRFTCDLSFLGNRLPDREARVKEFFMQVAEKMPRKKFILGGSGWGDFPFPPNVKYVNHVYSSDHNAFNSSAKVVLNISRQSMADYGFSPATRVFEAAGAGACIITDYWQGIENFFTPGKEILVANDGAEVAKLLGSITDKEATSIGAAAKLKVLAKHTYQQRAQLMNNILLKQEVLF